jgi:pyruvate carboxylase
VAHSKQMPIELGLRAIAVYSKDDRLTVHRVKAG